MREGRNENLLNALNIEGIAKKKAMKLTLLIFVAEVILMVLIGVFDEEANIYQWILISFLTILILIFTYFFLAKIYKDEEVEKVNSLFVEGCLSTEHFTEVIPINQTEHKSFVLGLQNRAKFYAIISKNDSKYVNVYVKFLDEEEGRFLETIHKGYFLEYYSIQEDEQEEKE